MEIQNDGMPSFRPHGRKDDSRQTSSTIEDIALANSEKKRVQFHPTVVLQTSDITSATSGRRTAPTGATSNASASTIGASSNGDQSNGAKAFTPTVPHSKRYKVLQWEPVRSKMQSSTGDAAQEGKKGRRERKMVFPFDTDSGRWLISRNLDWKHNKIESTLEVDDASLDGEEVAGGSSLGKRWKVPLKEINGFQRFTFTDPLLLAFCENRSLFEYIDENECNANHGTVAEQFYNKRRERREKMTHEGVDSAELAEERPRWVYRLWGPVGLILSLNGGVQLFFAFQDSASVQDLEGRLEDLLHEGKKKNKPLPVIATASPTAAEAGSRQTPAAAEPLPSTSNPAQTGGPLAGGVSPKAEMVQETAINGKADVTADTPSAPSKKFWIFGRRSSKATSKGGAEVASAAAVATEPQKTSLVTPIPEVMSPSVAPGTPATTTTTTITTAKQTISAAPTIPCTQRPVVPPRQNDLNDSKFGASRSPDRSGFSQADTSVNGAVVSPSPRSRMSTAVLNTQLNELARGGAVHYKLRRQWSLHLKPFRLLESFVKCYFFVPLDEVDESTRSARNRIRGSRAKSTSHPRYGEDKENSDEYHAGVVTQPACPTTISQKEMSDTLVARINRRQRRRRMRKYGLDKQRFNGHNESAIQSPIPSRLIYISLRKRSGWQTFCHKFGSFSLPKGSLAMDLLHTSIALDPDRSNCFRMESVVFTEHPEHYKAFARVELLPEYGAFTHEGRVALAPLKAYGLQMEALTPSPEARTMWMEHLLRYGAALRDFTQPESPVPEPPLRVADVPAAALSPLPKLPTQTDTTLHPASLPPTDVGPLAGQRQPGLLTPLMSTYPRDGSADAPFPTQNTARPEHRGAAGPTPWAHPAVKPPQISIGDTSPDDTVNVDGSYMDAECVFGGAPQLPLRENATRGVDVVEEEHSTTLSPFPHFSNSGAAIQVVNVTAPFVPGEETPTETPLTSASRAAQRSNDARTVDFSYGNTLESDLGSSAEKPRFSGSTANASWQRSAPASRHQSNLYSQQQLLTAEGDTLSMQGFMSPPSVTTPSSSDVRPGKREASVEMRSPLIHEESIVQQTPDTARRQPSETPASAPARLPSASASPRVDDTPLSRIPISAPHARRIAEEAVLEFRRQQRCEEEDAVKHDGAADSTPLQYRTAAEDRVGSDHNYTSPFANRSGTNSVLETSPIPVSVAPFLESHLNGTTFGEDEEGQIGTDFQLRKANLPTAATTTSHGRNSAPAAPAVSVTEPYYFPGDGRPASTPSVRSATRSASRDPRPPVPPAGHFYDPIDHSVAPPPPPKLPPKDALRSHPYESLDNGAMAVGAEEDPTACAAADAMRIRNKVFAETFSAFQ